MEDLFDYPVSPLLGIRLLHNDYIPKNIGYIINDEAVRLWLWNYMNPLMNDVFVTEIITSRLQQLQQPKLPKQTWGQYFVYRLKETLGNACKL